MLRLSQISNFEGLATEFLSTKASNASYGRAGGGSHFSDVF